MFSANARQSVNASGTCERELETNRLAGFCFGDNMKEISLTQGKVALVDDGDYEYLNQWKWFAHKYKNNKWYAERSEGWGVFEKKIRMHRIITNAPTGMEVDHKDNNGLNNQRQNLRVCTKSQNIANTNKIANTTSKFKGVSWRSDSKKWKAQIEVNKKAINLGSYSDPEEAARVYDDAATKYYGEFAKLNFPRRMSR